MSGNGQEIKIHLNNKKLSNLVEFQMIFPVEYSCIVSTSTRLNKFIDLNFPC